ncbi:MULTISPECIES: nuclear transport factor 2 family protein [unclassified Streptomyces]|uniref:nuclear transport factor 2 family protein n=1 Tax=unclassified Streptomyces TaxID=2593676 RepID=UPI00278C8754|nr:MULTISPECIES: nuclear transport factor 2 family protein [unclassified Streptomyces]
MSEQTAAVVERLYEALEKEDIETVLEIFHPEVRITTPPALPWSTGYYEGHAGAAAYFTGALQYLEETTFKVQEIRVCGDWAAAVGDWSGRFRRSGGEFDVRFVHFWELSEGRVVRTEGISDTDGIVRAYQGTA